MEENNNISTQLRRLRKEAGVSMIDMAKALGFNNHSGYQYYENSYKKKYLPYDVVFKIKPLLVKGGASEENVDKLAGRAVAEAPLTDKDYKAINEIHIDTSVIPQATAIETYQMVKDMWKMRFENKDEPSLEEATAITNDVLRMMITQGRHVLSPSVVEYALEMYELGQKED